MSSGRACCCIRHRSAQTQLQVLQPGPGHGISCFAVEPHQGLVAYAEKVRSRILPLVTRSACRKAWVTLPLPQVSMSFGMEHGVRETQVPWEAI